jgi:hypothetical protein
MAQVVGSGTLIRGGGARRVWRSLRPEDPRYPRPKPVVALRAIGKVGWLPFTVYVGNAATGLVTAFAAHGLGAAMNPATLTHTLLLDGAMTLAQRSPLVGGGLLALLAALLLLVRVAYLDARREVAILRSRDMISWMQARSERAMTADRLRDDLRALREQLSDDRAALPTDPGARNAALKQRLTSLTAISEMLSGDLALRAMWDEAMARQMATWDRRQRLSMMGTGVATIAIGGLLPILLTSL